ncbi:thromboxane A2 receptor [Austrofundulus limnaeus]|uniref:Thromboxane A2 receptor n=1 Tax=Austrofundulus limnaeus TaxID=52670 RepID=A0A2I4BER4_AUSLI|nr:PREDICTED: thromboxane A2 receptor [Austrofundulus limnaeus]XP_013866230.1 PREDICTED: thromboxane A2 receptor [Austrofundulus limnaeus]
MNASNNTPLCYANTSTPYMYAPDMGKIYFSASFSALGLTSNLIAFIVLIKSCQQTKSRSRSFFLIFLAGLVVTDFMGLLVTGSFVISFYITWVDWRQFDPTCHFCNFMGMSMVFYGLCPLLLGATMAVERFVGINCPFARSTNITKGRTVSMVLMVWFFAGCISLLPLIGFGSYHIQTPGSWCFLNISPERHDWAFSLLFSFVGLICIAVSFLLNTVSLVTLIKVCCGPDRNQRRRDHEVEMMVQLILIMTIATVCWCPLLVFIAQTALSGSPMNVRYLLIWIRFATWNQILDPWVYILFRRSVLKRLYPRIDLPQRSIMTSYASFSENMRRFTRPSLGNLSSHDKENVEKSNVAPPSTVKPSA